MLRQFTGKDESDTAYSKKLTYPQISKHDLRGLNLTGGNGGFLVVGGQFGCLGGNALENIWDQNQIHVGVEFLGALPLTNEFKMDMARFEIPVSGCTCFNTMIRVSDTQARDESTVNPLDPPANAHMMAFIAQTRSKSRTR